MAILSPARTGRSAARWIALLLAASIPACAPVQPSEGPAPDGAAIEVMLDPPRDIRVATRDGDTVIVRRVTEVLGQSNAMRDGMLRISLSGTRSGGGPLVSMRGWVTIEPDSGVKVTVLSRDPGPVNFFGALALPGAAVAFVAMLWYGFRGDSD